MESLYSSIPHEVGIQAVSQWLDVRHPLAGPHNEFLIELPELVLNNNLFIFDSKYYHQKRGVAMGASCAPSYACLHLGWWEKEEVYKHPAFQEHVACWVLFIDDVLVVWRGTKALMNRKEKTKIVTNTFRKPTAGNTLLHTTSHHPWPIIRGIPTG